MILGRDWFGRCLAGQEFCLYGIFLLFDREFNDLHGKRRGDSIDKDCRQRPPPKSLEDFGSGRCEVLLELLGRLGEMFGGFARGLLYAFGGFGGRLWDFLYHPGTFFDTRFDRSRGFGNRLDGGGFGNASIQLLLGAVHGRLEFLAGGLGDVCGGVCGFLRDLLNDLVGGGFGCLLCGVECIGNRLLCRLCGLGSRLLDLLGGFLGDDLGGFLCFLFQLVEK